MKIIIISDTHNSHSDIEIPDADILIHCGDSTKTGTKKEVVNFLEWFAKQKPKYKICISGNHDLYFFRNNSIADYYPEIIYLENSYVTIEGFTIYGSPYTKKRSENSKSVFCEYEDDLIDIWGEMPDETDILITHSPPFKILDKSKKGKNFGSESLREKVDSLDNLKIHCFGHIHNGFGVRHINGVEFINASYLNGRFEKDCGFIETLLDPQ